jgi:ornithine cyclodeaminase/alanine dehydrogenase-like protein (mu-crystallin family)
MENLLPMSEEIDAIEQAFRELGQGKAMNAPRARLRTPWKEESGQYYFNNIMGLVPGVKSMALRIDSSFSKEVQVAGVTLFSAVLNVFTPKIALDTNLYLGVSRLIVRGALT